MNVTLRPLKHSDAAALAANADNPRVSVNLTDAFPSPYTIEDGVQFIRMALEAPHYHRAIMVDGAVAGVLGVTFNEDVYRKSAKLGYFIGELFWGRGVMTEAVRLACAEVFRNYDIVRISAEVFGYNKPSRRVLEKAGFVLEGVTRCSIFKNGVLHDGYLYALLREDIRQA